MFKLARDLGCTVRELLHEKRLSAVEFTWWQGFYSVEAAEIRREQEK